MKNVKRSKLAIQSETIRTVGGLPLVYEASTTPTSPSWCGWPAGSHCYSCACFPPVDDAADQRRA